MRRRIRRTPRNLRASTEFSSSESVIANIIDTLYLPHDKYWRKKLQTLLLECLYVAQAPVPDAPDCLALSYAGQYWPVDIKADSVNTTAVFIPEDNPELEKQAIKIVSNLEELNMEMYEVQRFLAGVLLFPAPLEVLKETFGNSLFGRIKKFFAPTQFTWGENEKAIYLDYIEEHGYLIDSMCQRIMISMMSQVALDD